MRALSRRLRWNAGVAHLRGYLGVLAVLALWLGVFAAVELAFRAWSPTHPLGRCRARQAEAVHCLRQMTSVAPFAPGGAPCTVVRSSLAGEECQHLRYYGPPQRTGQSGSIVQMDGREHGRMAGDRWQLLPDGTLKHPRDPCARLDVLDPGNW